jgi:hypothetical protein
MPATFTVTSRGIAVIKYVYTLMKIDREWSVCDDRGFTWWGKDFVRNAGH